MPENVSRSQTGLNTKKTILRNMLRNSFACYASTFFRDEPFVSTVGRNEEVIRQYIKNQEAEDKRLDQLRLWN